MSKPTNKRKALKKYSIEFKQSVVNSIEQEGLSAAEASYHYKVPHRTIYSWLGKHGKIPIVTETINVVMKSESDKIRKLESLVSELSIKCKVLREQVKIYEEVTGEEGKKKLNMKQLEELERLKKEAEDLLK